MFTLLGDIVGRAYLETQQAMGRICGKNRPILMMYRPFPSLRQRPPSSFSFRFGLLLVRVSDGNMSGDQDGDAGGAYLETQQALGQICGKNRPIVVLFRPFFCIRRLPSYSVSFRHLPSASVAGRFWSVWMMETFMGARMMMSGDHIWKPNRPWAEFAAKIDRF